MAHLGGTHVLKLQADAKLHWPRMVRRTVPSESFLTATRCSSATRRSAAFRAHALPRFASFPASFPDTLGAFGGFSPGGIAFRGRGGASPAVRSPPRLPPRRVGSSGGGGSAASSHPLPNQASSLPESKHSVALPIAHSVEPKELKTPHSMDGGW